MILTGREIEKQMEAGNIHISPFDPKNLGANSYDVCLSHDLLVYDLLPSQSLDMRRETPTRILRIPDEGLVLRPGVLYLGATNETATSHRYVPMFEGRSSMGRLGICTHITAGFGDVGWGYFRDPVSGSMVCKNPTWTLEMTVVHPVRVYAGIRIGQVYFLKPDGEISYYAGKYSQQRKPQASLMHLDFEGNKTNV